MTNKNQEVAVVDKKMLAELKDLYPVEQNSFTKIMLPRLSFSSQDVMSGEGKKKVCTVEAGTFFTERQSDEVNAEGKKIWKKEEIGSAMTGVILYHRYQLSYYDESTEEYTSSPVYDSQDEVLPLWCNKKEIARATPKELKAMYKFIDKDGKEKSKLKDNRVLYVLYQGELMQLDLHGSSMFSFMKYARTVVPASVMTAFASEPQEKGTIKWNMMTFKPVHNLPAEQIQDVILKVKDIVMAIQAEKGGQTSFKKAEVDMEKAFQDM